MPKKQIRKGPNRYESLLIHIFNSKYQRGIERIQFERNDLKVAAKKLRMTLPSNLGDVLYAHRFRADLPAPIARAAGQGKEWRLRLAGRGRYEFVLGPPSRIAPNSHLAETRVPDSTPGVISLYRLSDEQALLAVLRYNRLIDVFTGVTCYSLQNHLRTTVKGLGQVETDEIYIGMDRNGAHFVIPVQAKGGRDSLNLVQIEQDFELCRDKFPNLICKPVAAQFLSADTLALFAFELQDGYPRIKYEEHYRLVPAEDLSPEEIEKYRRRSCTRS